MDKALRGYGKAPVDYAEFTLCREMHWSFNELEEQPAWRIEQAFLFLQREKFHQDSQSQN